ncbi:MAG: T9SS type A sorting domain-containing protein [Bacteroidetes bacterium]|nr:T9SS type A sorting domain-containing protein [Bacteroidota bacterium]
MRLNFPITKLIHISDIRLSFGLLLLLMFGFSLEIKAQFSLVSTSFQEFSQNSNTVVSPSVNGFAYRIAFSRDANNSQMFVSAIDQTNLNGSLFNSENIGAISTLGRISDAAIWKLGNTNLFASLFQPLISNSFPYPVQIHLGTTLVAAENGYYATNAPLIIDMTTGDYANNRVFIANAASTIFATSTISSSFNNDAFGRAIALSLNASHVVIGAPSFLPATYGSPLPNVPGKVYVYSGNPASNNYANYLTFTGTENGDRFGSAVAISKDASRIFVGAPNTANGTGAVFIYNGSGQLITRIDGSSSGEQFGANLHVSHDGTVVAIGAPNKNGRGAVSVYEEISGTYQSKGTEVQGENNNDAFGTTLKLSADGSILAVTAPGNGGKVISFRFRDNFWTTISVNSPSSASSGFGIDIDLTDDGLTLAVASSANGQLGFVSFYDYKEPKPVITSVFPNSGAEGATFRVGIKDFPNQELYLKSVHHRHAAIIDSSSANWLYARVPSGITSGRYTLESSDAQNAYGTMFTVLHSGGNFSEAPQSMGSSDGSDEDYASVTRLMEAEIENYRTNFPTSLLTTGSMSGFYDNSSNTSIGTKQSTFRITPYRQAAYYENRVPETNLNHLEAIATGDINGNGTLNIVLGGNFLWLLNKRPFFSTNELSEGFSYPFTDNLISNTVGTIADIFIGNIAGDGGSHLVYADREHNKIAWMRNVGGSYIGETLIGGGVSGVSSIALVDINNNNSLDVFSASPGDNTLAWYENTQGDGSAWTKHIISSNLTGVQKLAATDFDGDGLVDVAVTLPSQHTLAWFKNLGNGQFSSINVLTTSAWNTPGLVATDLNGDGRAEIAVALRAGEANGSSSGSFMWFQNISAISESQVFAAPRNSPLVLPFSVNSGNVTGIYAINPNGDGKMDIALTTVGASRMYLYSNSDPEPYVIIDNFFPKSGSEGTHLTINGEGFGTTTQGVSVSINGVALQITSVVNTQINAVLPAGIQPGYHQISVTNTTNGKQKSSMGHFSYTQQSGLFSPKQLLVSGSQKQMLFRKNRLYYESASGGIHIFENGQNSVVVANKSISGKMLIQENVNERLYFWPSDGTTSEPVFYELDSSTLPAFDNPNAFPGKAFTIAVVNQFGFSDVIFANQTSLMMRPFASTNETTSIGGLPFPIFELSQFGEPVEALASGDLDNDGYVDILMLGNSKVAWLKNMAATGGGLVYQGNVITGLTQATEIKLADFTKSNRLDIAILDKGTEQIKIYSNNGSASFSQTHVLDGAGAQPSITTFLLADVLGIGRKDVVIAAGNSAYLYRNSSTGFSATPELITTSENPIVYLESGDANNDGRTDLFFSGTSGIYQVLNTSGEPVVQLLPENGVQHQPLRPTFSWDALAEIETYVFQVSEHSNFSSLVINETISNATSYQVSSDLDYFKTYYWRVRGIDNSYSPVLPMTWSETRSCQTFLLQNGEGTAQNPYKIFTVEELNRVRFGLTQHFELHANLDLAPHTSVNTGQFWNGGSGWDPIGSLANPFRGSFNGKGHTISGLFINRPAQNQVAFFGALGAAAVSNVRLENVSITGHSYVGGLAGEIFANSTISHVSISGTVTATGDWDVGGISSRLIASTLHRSSNEATITGNNSTGGLIGWNEMNSTITESWSSGNISGRQFVGGLVGYNSGTITNTYAAGNVVGSLEIIGGLVGNLDTGTISTSYSSGSVTLTNPNSTAIGGLIGRVAATVSNSFWNTQTSGQADSNPNDGMFGITSESMKAQFTFTNASWNFDSIWAIRKDSAISYPYLQGVIPANYPGISSLPRITLQIPGPHAGWRMLGSPSPDARYSDVLRTLWTQGFPGAANNPDSPSNVFYYDEATRNWVKPQHNSNRFGTASSEEINTAGKAILVYMYENTFPQTLDYYGIQNNGEISVTLSNTVKNPDDLLQGYHLVSNPYPFAIDWKKVVADGLNQVSPVIFIYDANTFNGAGGYRVHYGFDVPSLPGTINHNGIIPPFQGFWLRTSQMDGTNGTVTFKPSHAATGEGILYKSNGKDSKTSEISLEEFLSLSVENKDKTLAASSILVFSDSDSVKILEQYAPISLGNSPIEFGWKSDEVSQLSTLKQVVTDKIEVVQFKLGFFASQSDEFEIRLNSLSLGSKTAELVLTDLETNEVVTLRTKDKSLFVFSYESPEQLNKKAISELSLNVTQVPVYKEFLVEIRFIEASDSEPKTEIPTVAALYQNYPNPFNPTTTIRYDVPETGLVTIELFDITGRKVKNLVNGISRPGVFTATLNASSLSSGLYIYRMSLNSKIIAFKKLLLLK